MERTRKTASTGAAGGADKSAGRRAAKRAEPNGAKGERAAAKRPAKRMAGGKAPKTVKEIKKTTPARLKNSPRNKLRPDGAGAWRQNPEGVRQNILAVAWRAFVENGLSGARVDDIAARTATSKRMIYYYFGDKEGLYRAVLSEAYSRIRTLEKTLDLATLPPREAMQRLTAFTFDYHAANPDFVRLVMIENIHYASHLKTLAALQDINLPAIDLVSGIYNRGVAEGVFRAGLDPIDIHLTITAMSFYNVSNRESIQQVFRHDMAAPKAHARRRDNVVDAVMRYVGKWDGGSTG